jgi:hypothetical protein
MANKLTVAQIKNNIGLIAKNAAELNILIHETAYGAMVHAMENSGDCSLAQCLVMAMPTTMRRTQLIAWFGEYSPIIVKNDESWPGKIVKGGKIAARGWLLDEANNKPWYVIADENEEKEVKRLSLEELIAMVKAYGNRIAKKIENNEIEEKDKIPARLFSQYLAQMDLPNFRVEAYMAGAMKSPIEPVETDLDFGQNNPANMIQPEPKPDGEAKPEAQAA